MKSKFSISSRLTLWYSLMLFLALTFFGTLTFYLISRQLYDEQFEVLSENAEQISEFIQFNDGRINLHYIVEETDEMNLKKSGIFFEIWADSQSFIYRSPNFPRFLKTNFTFPTQSGPQKLKDSTGTVFRIYTTAIRLPVKKFRQDREYRLRVGQSILYVKKVLKRISRFFLLLIPFTLLLASAGGWYLARHALRPVADITRAAHDISLHQLGTRLPDTKKNDELGRLMQTFNEMIGRIESGVKKVRQFTADASHELRTPLTILRGEIEVALRKQRTPKEYKKVLRSALQEIGWMQKIVADLLLLSRADTGNLLLHFKTVEMGRFISQIVEIQKIQAHARQISLEFNLPSEEMKCAIDPDRIEQVLRNILDNAFKYSPPGGKVNIQLRRKNDQLYLLFKDTGRGISEEDLPFVFDRFYRVNRARSRGQHSIGLGLAICKWIVEAHQGTIKIESKLNRGTTVAIILPCSHKLSR